MMNPDWKRTVVFDMDDTLCDFTTDALVIVQQMTGRKLSREDFAGGSTWLEDVLTEEELQIVKPAIFNPMFYMSLRPTPLALALALSEQAKQLRQRHYFHVVTARSEVLPGIALRITESWLHSHNVKVRGVTVTEPRMSKIAAAAASAVIFVEDSATVAQDALNCGKTVVLIDEPWNKHLKGQPRLYRRSANWVVPTLHGLLETGFGL